MIVVVGVRGVGVAVRVEGAAMEWMRDGGADEARGGVGARRGSGCLREMRVERRRCQVRPRRGDEASCLSMVVFGYLCRVSRVRFFSKGEEDVPRRQDAGTLGGRQRSLTGDEEGNNEGMNVKHKGREA